MKNILMLIGLTVFVLSAKAQKDEEEPIVYQSKIKTINGDYFLIDGDDPFNNSKPGNLFLKDTEGNKHTLKWNDVEWAFSHGNYYMRRHMNDERTKTEIMLLLIQNDRFSVYQLRKPGYTLLYIYDQNGNLNGEPVEYLYSVDKKREENHRMVIERLKMLFQECNNKKVFDDMNRNLRAETDIFFGLTPIMCDMAPPFEKTFQ